MGSECTRAWWHDAAVDPVRSSSDRPAERRRPRSKATMSRRDSVPAVSLPPPVVSELDIRGVEQRAKELPVAGFRRGYRVAQVDGFLSQAVASLRALLAENEGLRVGVDPGNLWYQGASATSPHTPAEVGAQTFE